MLQDDEAAGIYGSNSSEKVSYNLKVIASFVEIKIQQTHLLQMDFNALRSFIAEFLSVQISEVFIVSGTNDELHPASRRSGSVDSGLTIKIKVLASTNIEALHITEHLGGIVESLQTFFLLQGLSSQEEEIMEAGLKTLSILESKDASPKIQDLSTQSDSELAGRLHDLKDMQRTVLLKAINSMRSLVLLNLTFFPQIQNQRNDVHFDVTQGVIEIWESNHGANQVYSYPSFLVNVTAPDGYPYQDEEPEEKIDKEYEEIIGIIPQVRHMAEATNQMEELKKARDEVEFLKI